MHRGSRKHILDWSGRSTFVAEFAALLHGLPVEFRSQSVVLPRGHAAPDEARLDTFGPAWPPDDSARAQLAEWWLIHPKGANTPNWDILVTCEIEGRPGLVLVEAKANGPELSRAGKALRKDVSRASMDNHAHIGTAILQATAGWRTVDPRVTLSRDSHYQLANRLAFTWKLATLGIPVVLMYLGFTGDVGLRGFFPDRRAWDDALQDYLEGVFPRDQLECRVVFNGTPCWVLARGREVLEPSPPAW